VSLFHSISFFLFFILFSLFSHLVFLVFLSCFDPVNQILWWVFFCKRSFTIQGGPLLNHCIICQVQRHQPSFESSQWAKFNNLNCCFCSKNPQWQVGESQEPLIYALDTHIVPGSYGICSAASIEDQIHFVELLDPQQNVHLLVRSYSTPLSSDFEPNNYSLTIHVQL
jgi:hypothetical protein